MCNTTSSNGRVSSFILSQVQCDLCSKYFVNKSVLKKHINAIHQNIYFFKCSYPNCTRTFRTRYRLYVHELFHSGIKPFTCEFCGKGFAEKGTLKVHQRSHSSICYFNCEYCTYGCKTESHLREHYKVKHNKYDFYKCSICKKHFNLKSDYCYHLKKHNINQNKTTLNFLNINYNNTCNIDTDCTLSSKNDNCTVNEIQFGVYAI